MGVCGQSDTMYTDIVTCLVRVTHVDLVVVLTEDIDSVIAYWTDYYVEGCLYKISYRERGAHTKDSPLCGIAYQSTVNVCVHICKLQEQRLLSASRLYTTSVIVFIATLVCALTICLTDRPPKPKQEGTVD